MCACVLLGVYVSVHVCVCVCVYLHIGVEVSPLRNINDDRWNSGEKIMDKILDEIIQGGEDS